MTAVTHPAPHRGRNRTLAALLILVAWTAGVGMLVRREFFREKAAVLAEAALRLGPSTSFYAVEQNGQQIGYASTTIDTSRTAFEVVDYFTADLPVAGQQFRASARSVISLSRSLAVRTFDVQIESSVSPMSVSGYADGDSAIVYVMSVPGQPSDTQRLAVSGPILLPTMIPAAAMLVTDPKVGRTVTIASFDPATLAAKDLTLRFAAESLFTLVDSARYDSTAMQFVPALSDTVRAWNLVPTEGQGFSGWVDAQGRVVASTQPGGITIKRMAYEIAFENWRRARGSSGASARAADRCQRRRTRCDRGRHPRRHGDRGRCPARRVALAFTARATLWHHARGIRPAGRAAATQGAMSWSSPASPMRCSMPTGRWRRGAPASGRASVRSCARSRCCR